MAVFQKQTFWRSYMPFMENKYQYIDPDYAYTNKSIYDRYMHGTINSDVNTLTELILEQIINQ